MNKDNFIYKAFLKNKSVKTDSRKVKKGDIFFALSGENFNGNEFVKSALKNGSEFVIGDDELKIASQFSVDNYEKLLKEKKIIIVKSSLKALQNLAEKYRQDLKIPFLAITGSNGKTTTKELIREVLVKKYNVLATKGNLNNHIGVPLTILSIKPEHNFAIIEMGANHIGEIKVLAEIVKPDFGIITNIGLAHVGEFGSLENIIKTKKELYEEILKNKGKLFLNQDDETLQKISTQFSVENKIFYKKTKNLNSDGFLQVKIDGKKIETKLVGEYNIFNIQAAFTVGGFFKVETDKIVKALENYKPENNRSQKDLTEKGNEIVWDCYNANPTSMKLAIESFSKIPVFGNNEKITIEQSRVYGIIKNDKGEYLIQNFQKTGNYWWPGGGIEKGEKELESLKREILEETGYVDFKIKEKICSCVYNYVSDEKKKNRKNNASFYKVELLSSEREKVQPTESEKKSGMVSKWMKKSDIIEKINEQVIEEDRRKIIMLPIIIKEKVLVLGEMAELGDFSIEEHKKVLKQITIVAGKKLLVGEEFKKFEREFSEKKDFKFFKDVLELENFLEKEKIQNSEILVKGSNSTKLFILKDKEVF